MAGLTQSPIHAVREQAGSDEIDLDMLADIS
jgi:hypothetical protein